MAVAGATPGLGRAVGRGRAVRGPGRRNTLADSDGPNSPSDFTSGRNRGRKCVVASPLFVDMGAFTLNATVRYYETGDMFDLRDVLDIVYGNKDQGIRAMWRLRRAKKLGTGVAYMRVRWHDPDAGLDARNDRKGRVVCTSGEVTRMLNASTANYRNTAPEYLAAVSAWFTNEAGSNALVFM